MKSSLDEYGDRLPQADKEQAREIVDRTLRWLDSNQTAEKEEFEDQLNEAQRVLSKIMAKLHQPQGEAGAGSGQQPGGGYPGGQGQYGGAGGCGAGYGQHGGPGAGAYGGGPKVEEVD